MSLEQMDHFLRHVKMHAEELENETFSKDIGYLEKLKFAQYKAKDVAHDLFHVMREKGFEGYKDNDFNSYIPLPDDYKQHSFRTFDYESFRLAINVKYIMTLGMVMERDIPLNEDEARKQMEILYYALEDAEVFLQMLEVYFEQHE